MKLTRRRTAGLGLTLGLLIATPFAVGTLLPRDHIAEGVRALPIGADEVFWRAVDIDGWAEWRAAVDSITHIEGSNFEAIVHGLGESIRYGFELDVEQRTMTAEILSTGLPYGGRWTISVVETGERASEVRVTEEGFVTPPVWRFVAHVIIGTETSLSEYLDDLVAECAAGSCGSTASGAD
ncbi:MAG: hypothetical protein AAF389_18105 [Gemmatimonadota bacterium]